MAQIVRRLLGDEKTVRYDVRFRVDGVVRNKTFRLRGDADAYKRKVEGDELAGLIVDPRGGERAFGPYATAWIDTRLAKGRPLTPATRQGYKGLLRRHLNPAFEKAALRKITPERVRVWHSHLIKSAGPDQAAKSYRLLRAILNTAVSDRLLTQNPCTVPGAGAENTPERPLLDTATVLDLADAIEPRLRALVLLAGFGALRPGELLGLERRDFDTLRGTVQVRRQAQEITGMGRTITAPKSGAGTRTVALPGIVTEEMRQHLGTYVASTADSPVFTRKTGRPLRRRDLSESWKAACAAVGIAGAHVHDLRHHGATMAAQTGITTRELMVRIGHSSPRAALIYQHATEERDSAVADQLDTLIASTERTLRAKVVKLPRDPRAMDAG